MIRDVRNYTTNHSVDALSPNHVVGDPSVLELLEDISTVHNRDLGLSSADPSPAAEDTPADDSLASPGVVRNPESGNGALSPAASPSGPAPAGSSSGPASPPGTSGTGSAAIGAASRGRSACRHGSSRGGRDTRGDSSRGAFARGGIATRGGRGSMSGCGSRGGRGSMSAPPDTRITRAITRVPNQKTLSELRQLSYAFLAMGEIPDVAHRDATLGFTEYAYAVGAVQPDVPRTIQEARASPDGAKWNAAAKREMKSLNDRKVYKLVPRSAVPAGRERIKYKWVFKRKADGSFKGRVVAQGWNQVPRLDCGSTCAPVCRIQSVRILACITVEFNLIFNQKDVFTAFLYTDIQEQVFVEQPPGFEVKDKNGSDMVMQLKKSLYGLAQSSGNWFNTIDPVLFEIGFVALKSDPCVYLYDHNGAKIYLTLYVDDLRLAGDDSNAISMVKEKLQKRFKMTDMGEASLVLGMEIKRDREAGTLTISQEAYCKSILEQFGMSNCQPTSTPGYGSEISNNQPKDTLLNGEETRKYQGIVGSLMYIPQVLRYDIMHATGQLARPMAKPSKVHMVAAKHTLRYLAGTTNFSITYKKGGFKLAIFSNSNWANNPDNGKSTSSYVTILANDPMSFRSGLQGLTAMSTMEAELVASALAMKEAVFCSNMLTELGFGKEFAQLPVYCDNTATVHALGKRSFSSRTKHIALRFFFIRELVTEGRISIHSVPTEDNLADIGIKHFNKHRFKHLIDLINKFDVNKFTTVEFKGKLVIGLFDSVCLELAYIFDFFRRITDCSWLCRKQ